MSTLLERIADGRTDLVFDYVAEGNPATAADANGVALIQHCAYYGDVSGIRFLLSKGESARAMGQDLGLNAACFHGHWRLVQFVLEQGAKVNSADRETGETPLHSAIVKPNSLAHNLVVKVLLDKGASPNKTTKKAKPTGAFMRDCSTKGETPLHRAAAFGDESMIQMLVDAGAKVDAKDMNGETPLSWASWYSRPTPILRKLLYGKFRINPAHAGMAVYLLGKPHA